MLLLLRVHSFNSVKKIPSNYAKLTIEIAEKANLPKGKDAKLRVYAALRRTIAEPPKQNNFISIPGRFGPQEFLILKPDPTCAFICKTSKK
jgi:hypothetical protein